MSYSEDQRIPDEEPLFNIGLVSEMTDIPEATLRVWERRYDFPESSRTAGGHRLYSQHEVMRLRWVKKRVDEGMQISKAVNALRHMEREGTSLFAALSPQPFTQREGDLDALGAFSERLVEALLAHDARRADQVLAEAMALYPLEYLILDMIGPAFSEIGEAWMEGRIDVATEHFATNRLRHHLLMWMRTGPPAYQVAPTLLACAPGELHEGSLLMLAVLLRRLRWPVIYLGQTMPLSDLAAFVEDVEPAIIVFVAMREETAHALADWPRWLPEVAERERPIVGYGGHIFMKRPELAQEIPGMLLGETLQEGVETLDRMLHELNPLLH